MDDVKRERKSYSAIDLARTLPLSRDGHRVGLGMEVWYPWSIDSFRGPHVVIVDAINRSEEVYIMDGKDSVGWVSLDSIFIKEENAKKARDNHGKK